MMGDPAQDPVAVTRDPSGREFRAPFAGDGLEALDTCLGELLRLAGVTGVDPGGELPAGIVPLLAGCLQADAA